MESDQIVIATNDCAKALFVISKSAMTFDKIEIHYGNTYAPTIEYLLRTLRKGFGWLEDERGEKEVMNTKCYFNEHNVCQKNNAIKCSEQMRQGCKNYKRKYDNPFKVNFVIIRKSGGIRGL